MMINFRLIMIALCMVTGLTACSSVPKPSLPFVGKKKEQDVAVPASIPQQQPQTEAPAPSPPKFVKADLLGLQVRQLDDLLGVPVFVRQEGRGEFRRYRNSVCNLVVIFAPDASGRIVSTQLETTAFYSSSAKPLLQDCLNGF